MSVYLKQGVCGTLKPIAQKGFGRVAALYEAQGKDLMVTSLREGNHTYGSFHYIGLAFDFQQDGVNTEDVIEALGPGWDVIPFRIDMRDKWYQHVEFDPKPS